MNRSGGTARPCRKSGPADAQELLAVAIAARTFLLPHWARWHEAWGPPAPMVLSQWTCVRSSLLLARVIERRGVQAILESGRPCCGPTCAAGGRSGFLTADGWVSHARVEAGAFVIDITADQFGCDSVILTPVGDPTYRRADDKAHRLTPTSAAHAAVDEIWPWWCGYADRVLSAGDKHPVGPGRPIMASAKPVRE